MRMILPRGGLPGEHLGISHTLKHYLRPEEMWQDLAGELEEGVQPLAVWGRLKHLSPRACDQAEEPEPELRSVWNEMDSVWKKGYGALVSRGGASVSPPAPGPWVPQEKGGWMTGLPGGVLLVVRPQGEGWRFITAYRPFNFILKDYDRPPRDARSVEIRRKLAGWEAERRLMAQIARSPS